VTKLLFGLLIAATLVVGYAGLGRLAYAPHPPDAGLANDAIVIPEGYTLARTDRLRGTGFTGDFFANYPGLRIRADGGLGTTVLTATIQAEGSPGIWVDVGEVTNPDHRGATYWAGARFDHRTRVAVKNYAAGTLRVEWYSGETVARIPR